MANLVKLLCVIGCFAFFFLLKLGVIALNVFIIVKVLQAMGVL